MNCEDFLVLNVIFRLAQERKLHIAVCRRLGGQDPCEDEGKGKRQLSEQPTESLGEKCMVKGRREKFRPLLETVMSVHRSKKEKEGLRWKW
jgi:hypothetical protein